MRGKRPNAGFVTHPESANHPRTGHGRALIIKLALEFSMKKKSKIILAGTGAIAVCASANVSAASGKIHEKPNILLILADDMGWSDMGCYGGEIQTPNLDSIAKRGVRFTQMHNTAKCFPSRACLLTGLYAQQCGMSRGAGTLSLNSATFGEVFTPAGYRTVAVGKHHGKDNLHDRGFDHYWGLRDGAANYFNPGYRREGEKKPAQKKYGGRTFCFDEAVLRPFTPGNKNFYSTDAYTRWALDFLDRYRNEDKPFFLYLSYQAPHDPLQAHQEDISKYRGKYMNGYAPVRRKRYARQKEMGLIDDSFPLSEATHREWDSLTQEEKEDQDLRMAVYAAMIECMDRNIGEVLEKIRSMGEEENTIVIFASDNGCSPVLVEKGDGEIGTMSRWSSLGPDWANVSNTPFRYYKNWSHEGGTCTPFIISWPSRITETGGINHFPCHFIDVMPTLVAAAKIKYPATLGTRQITPMPGVNLMPVIENKKKLRDTTIFWQWAQGKAVRKDNWKLVSDRKKPWSLYNMSVDKTETKDLARENPELVRNMEKLYINWYESK